MKLVNQRVLAIITEIAGKVSIRDEKKRKEVTVTSNDDSRTYLIPFGSKLKVREGDVLEAGDQITEGSKNPAEVLAISGPQGVFEYIIARSSKGL